MPVRFQPGATLCERLYWIGVRHILDTHFPRLLHAAALIDGGSKVLGFDDPMSTDHHCDRDYCSIWAKTHISITQRRCAIMRLCFLMERTYATYPK
jgi:hypothetical protein